MIRKSNLCCLLLCLALLGLGGCGGSSDNLGQDLNPIGPPAGAVPHRSWGGYRLYTYDGVGWQLLVNVDGPVAGVPALGARPVLVVHGLGSTISRGRLNTLAERLENAGATAIFGFEYDTLDPIARNASLLGEALDFLTRRETSRRWRVVAHSLGALVARSSFESGRTFNMATTGNLVSLVAGPHQGSPIAAELRQADPSVVDQALEEVVLNGELNFYNADGSRVDVSGNETVFAQLVPNSSFLDSLNFEAFNNHPQFEYRTLAGTQRGDRLEAFNRTLGVFADDGIVNVPSANAAVIGPASTEVTPHDHNDIIEDMDALLIALAQVGF